MDEGRGLRDPEGVKRKQQRKEDLEKTAAKNDQRGERSGLVVSEMMNKTKTDVIRIWYLSNHY